MVTFNEKMHKPGIESETASSNYSDSGPVLKTKGGHLCPQFTK